MPPMDHAFHAVHHVSGFQKAPGKACTEMIPSSDSQNTMETLGIPPHVLLLSMLCSKTLSIPIVWVYPITCNSG